MVVGLGMSQVLPRLTFRLLLLLLMWVHGLTGKVCKETIEVSFVVLMMYICTQIILEVMFMA